MIDSGLIYRKANSLVSRCGTRDTLKIAEKIGITVSYTDELENLLGMYTYMWKHRIILLNSRTDDIMLHMVCGHEIGHDQLHRDIAKAGALQEFVLFNINTNTEYEANAFLSHLTLDTDEVINTAKEGYDVVSMAKMLNTNVNLLLIKFQELNALGYRFRVPMEADSYFLKKQ